MTGDDRVQRIALVSQRNAENRHKNTIFVKPCNFYIPSSLQGDRTAILPVRWAFGMDTAIQTETDSLLLVRDRWFELTNDSAECVQPATAVSTPKAQRTGRSPIAECFSNFVRPELPFDHREG